MQGQYYPQPQKANWFKRVIIIIAVMAVAGIAYLVISSWIITGNADYLGNIFSDGCCNSPDCVSILNATISYARIHGGCACDQFTCVSYCQDMLRELVSKGFPLVSVVTNDTLNFTDNDCYSICPNSNTNRCGN